MKFKFLFVLLFIAFNAKAQFNRMYFTDVDFRETKADTLDVKLDSILLVGMGASLERMFLDDLSNKLIKDFSSKKIVATYTYLGKNTAEAKQHYQEINKDGYKAVFLFCPTDTSVFDIKHLSTSIIIPVPGGVLNLRPGRKRTMYEQTFDLQLFKIDKELTKIWCASVDIDCEPQKTNGSTKVGNKILARFKSNKYIR